MNPSMSEVLSVSSRCEGRLLMWKGQIGDGEFGIAPTYHPL